LRLSRSACATVAASTYSSSPPSGTARAFQLSEVGGAFGALAMGLNGLITAIIAPMIVHWLS